MQSLCGPKTCIFTYNCLYRCSWYHLLLVTCSLRGIRLVEVYLFSEVLAELLAEFSCAVKGKNALCLKVGPFTAQLTPNQKIYINFWNVPDSLKIQSALCTVCKLLTHDNSVVN